MKRFILTLSIICAFVSANAQIIESIHTTSGDVYEGYISGQTIGQSITVHAAKAVISIPTEAISLISIRSQKLSSLDPDIEEWVRKSSVQGSVELASITTKDKVYSNARILEQGYVTKIEVYNLGDVTIPWNKILKTTKSGCTGLYDIVALKNGTRHKGCIEEQVPSQSLRIRTIDNNCYNVRLSDVISISYETPENDANYLNSSVFIDKINLNNGGSKEGFIVSKHTSEGIVIAPLADVNTVETISFKDIKSYGKRLNPDCQVPMVSVGNKVEEASVEHDSIDDNQNSENQKDTPRFNEEKEEYEDVSVIETPSKPETASRPAEKDTDELYIDSKACSMLRAVSKEDDFNALCVYYNQYEHAWVAKDTEQSTSIKVSDPGRYSDIVFLKAKFVSEKVVKGELREEHYVFSEDATPTNEVMIELISYNRDCLEAEVSFKKSGVYVMLLKGTKRCIVFEIN